MSSQNQGSLRVLLLAGMSLFLCSITLVLGSIPLHAWRKSQGRTSYVVGTALLTSGLFFWGTTSLAVAYGLMSLLIFLFSEFETRLGAEKWLTSAFWSIVMTALSGLLLMKSMSMQMGQSIKEWLKAPAEKLLDQVVAVNPAVEVKFEDVFNQLPSAFILVLFVAMALALIFEGRIQQIFKIELRSRQKEFLAFRVPDFTVWLMLSALLAAFLRGVNAPGVQVVGINVLNVLLFVYFVQGMAVVTRFFMVQQVSPLWRTFLYFFLIVQFFVFVSGLGFVDYWLDFRKRMTSSENGKNKKAKGKGGIS